MRSDFRILLFCAVVAIVVLALFFVFQDTPAPEQSEAKVVKQELSSQPSEEQRPLKQLKPFDPNTADSATLVTLGLSARAVKSILKYRAKGGVYSTPEDFAFVPNLPKMLYKELLPYIIIGDDYRPARELVLERRRDHDYAPLRNDSNNVKPVFPRQEKMKPAERLSVNDADTTALKRVPGIGSYFARRIVEQRDRLGGFVSRSQLLDIKGFPESALEFLTIPDGGVKKINVNVASFKTLASHPLVGYRRTKTIVDYRRLKGQIHDMQQLTTLVGYTEEEAALASEYLEF